MNFVTDTHSLVWYFTADHRLGKKALNIFEQTVKEGSIIVPTIILAEIMFIAKRGRITLTFKETLKKLEDYENFNIVPLDIEILKITDNYETPDTDCDIDCVPNLYRKHKVNIALNNGFAFGGNNACLVLKKYSSA